MSPDTNPVTGSPKSTLRLIVVELVGLDCTDVTTGLGPISFMAMLAALDAVFSFPAVSCTRPAGMSTVSVWP